MNKFILTTALVCLTATSAYSLDIPPVRQAGNPVDAIDSRPAPVSLDLTDEQIAKRKELREKNREELNDIREQIKELNKSGAKSKEDSEKRRELINKMRELRKKEMQDFEAILTPEQKAKLENIKNQKR